MDAFMSDEEVVPVRAKFGSAITAPDASGSESESSGVLHLDAAVDAVLRQADLLSSAQLNDLMRMCDAHLQDHGERTLTLTEELNQTKRIIRQMKSEFFNKNGSRKGQTTTRELKEILSTMNTLTTTIGKLEALGEEQDRNRVLEKCVAVCMKEMPEDLQERFFTMMEDHLIDLSEHENEQKH